MKLNLCKPLSGYRNSCFSISLYYFSVTLVFLTFFSLFFVLLRIQKKRKEQMFIEYWTLNVRIKARKVNCVEHAPSCSLLLNPNCCGIKGNRLWDQSSSCVLFHNYCMDKAKSTGTKGFYAVLSCSLLYSGHFSFFLLINLIKTEFKHYLKGACPPGVHCEQTDMSGFTSDEVFVKTTHWPSSSPPHRGYF